jgi:hypothetical protein
MPLKNIFVFKCEVWIFGEKEMHTVLLNMHIIDVFEVSAREYVA